MGERLRPPVRRQIALGRSEPQHGRARARRSLRLTISHLVAKYMYKSSFVQDVETAESEVQHNDLLAEHVEEKSVELALHRALSLDRRRNGPSVDSTHSCTVG